MLERSLFVILVPLTVFQNVATEVVHQLGEIHLAILLVVEGSYGPAGMGLW